MIHKMYLAVGVAYDMYLEVEEGDIVQTWKDKNIVDLWTFHFLLSNKMVKYKPTHRKYSGDATMIPDTQENQSTRDRIKDYASG